MFLLLSSILTCGSGEREQLLNQLDELRTELYKSPFFEILAQMEDARKRLSKIVEIISALKKRQDVGEMMKNVSGVIPGSVWLKELFFSHRTLNLTLLFPTKNTITQFKTNMDKAKYFKRIEYFPGERLKPNDPYRYVVVCDYKKNPEGNTQLKETSKSRNRLKQEIEKIKRKLKKLKKYQKRESEIREELKAKKEILLKLAEILPPKVDINRVVKEIQTFVSQCKITLKKLLPKDRRNMEIYCEFPFEIELAGGYHPLENFIKMLEKRKRIFTISMMHITLSRGRLHQARLNVSLSVSTYSTRRTRCR